jgi:hypothetical protein
MKFNRKLLEEETLQKIKEVNDEAGYRKYLEVPEMVNIIASIIEERIQTLYDVRDAQSQQIANLTAHINKIENEDKHFSDFKAAEKKLIEFLKIINDTLRELPVGNISTHTPESIPERVGHWVRESAEECRLREQWEACADMLFAWADELKCGTLNQAIYEAVCEDIKKYEELKKENE